MGFEQAMEAMEASFNQAPEAEADTSVDSGADTGNAGDESTGDVATEPGESAAAAQALIDLDGAQKFKFQGKEWTPEELQAAILRQRDYTNKTKELANERRYMSNLAADLSEVKRNPALAAEFKKIYPEKFHNYLDVVLEQAAQAEAQGQAMQNGQANQAEPAWLKRLEQLENQLKPLQQQLSESQKKAYEAEVQTQEQHLGQLFGSFEKKYEFGVEEAVLTKAEALIAKGYEMNDAAWERLWKANHEANFKKYEAWNAAKVKAQLKNNKEGADIGAGGGIPAQGRKRMSFDEATEAAIASLSQKG